MQKKVEYLKRGEETREARKQKQTKNGEMLRVRAYRWLGYLRKSNKLLLYNGEIAIKNA